MLLFSLFIGFLAGVFEEPARYLVFKYFFTDKKKKLNKSGALLFGLGWGGIESILIAVLVLSSMIFYINAKPLSETDISAINQTMNGTMTENDVLLYNEQIASIGKLSPLDVLPGLLERIIAITIHIFFTLLVFKSVRENKLKYLIFAVMLHTLFDTLAVFINSEYGVLLTEFILLLIAVPAFFYIKKESLKI